ncbi:hypothetical protein NRS6084_03893 [Bacillus subtilis]|nr:hypothetical protein [Bacillus subtilis]PJN82402.1 hypothetical protein CV739_22035 [Bacillus velezensis]QAT57068.1 hypothetical protein EQW70_06690 [Bacillus subtilis]QHM06537.1 hypothetical protein C7M27_02475 [Bacillus subtilis]QYM59114.1 hypothetical protein K0V03_14230 [Bacillus subtilis]
MHMDFRVYQLLFANDLTSKTTELFDFLKNVAKLPGEHGFDYCITREIDETDNIITFCFSEEHAPNVNSVDDERNSYSPEVAPYLNTFVAIDLQEKRMLVQHRNYPPTNLDKDKTMVRIGMILEEAFQNIYNSVFNYQNTKRTINDEDFLNAFNDNRVTLLRVRLFQTGRRIIDGTQIFQDENLNNHWIQGFEADESDMYEVILKAPGKSGEGDLRNSPIAKSLLNLAMKEIIELNYWGEEGSDTMTRADLKRFRVKGINKDTDPITAINAICGEVLRRRNEVRRFRVIEDLD